MDEVKVCKQGHERSAALTRCPECSKERNRRYAQKRREGLAYRAREAEYQKDYRQRTKVQRQEYLEKNRESRTRNQRNAFLRRKYGITREQYDKMYDDQQGCCKICNLPPDKNNTKHGVLGVDHCHATLAVRGLLCDLCNKGIGLLKDDPQRLRSAIKYLEEIS